MSEIQPALLTQLELEWLLGKTNNLSKKTERDLRYRINKKIRIFMHTELPLLKDRGFAAALGNDAAAISSGGSGTGEHSLVGRGIANPEKIQEKHTRERRGEWDFRSYPHKREQNFEPTCPFGHGISNPTPYQARRPPQL
jgi:hypothetical protein